MRDDIAVITVNWNGWQVTLDCLTALRASKGASWRLFIVDNASTDDSIERLSGLGEDVVLIQAATNGGWTGGNNVGVRRALDEGYNYIFLLNNDAMVEPHTMSRLLAFSSTRSPPPVVGPLHRNIQSSRFDFIGASINESNGMPTYESGDESAIAQRPAFYPTAFVSGAGMFLSREHFENVGMFDDNFYLNYDETDWCYRARKIGTEIFMLKSAKIIHLVSASIGGSESPLNVYFMTRNSLLFAERHLSRRQRYVHLVSLLRYGRNLTFSPGFLRRTWFVVVGSDARARAFRAGLRDYVLRRFGDCPGQIRSL